MSGLRSGGGEGRPRFDGRIERRRSDSFAFQFGFSSKEFGPLIVNEGRAMPGPGRKFWKKSGPLVIRVKFRTLDRSQIFGVRNLSRVALTKCRPRRHELQTRLTFCPPTAIRGAGSGRSSTHEISDTITGENSTDTEIVDTVNRSSGRGKRSGTRFVARRGRLYECAEGRPIPPRPKHRRTTRPGVLTVQMRRIARRMPPSPRRSKRLLMR